MTREDHLIVIVGEEAAEIAQRASKCARFGCEEVQPGQDKNNAERLLGEVSDLLTALEMLASINPAFRNANRTMNADTAKILGKNKQEKVEEFLKYSAKRGRLSDDQH